MRDREIERKREREKEREREINVLRWDMKEYNRQNEELGLNCLKEKRKEQRI